LTRQWIGVAVGCRSAETGFAKNVADGVVTRRLRRYTNRGAGLPVTVVVLENLRAVLNTVVPAGQIAKRIECIG